VWPDERIIRLIEKEFIPVRVHVRDQASDFQRLGERYGAQWTPTTLVLDSDGSERHRVEGFLSADDLLAQLEIGLGQTAFKRGRWADAERHFQVATEGHPGNEAAAEAVYWSGVSRYKATNDLAALTATERQLSERYPDSTWAKKASVWR
jgi:hypothetical protein